MAHITRWYFPVRSDIESPYIMREADVNENQLNGSLDYVNGLRENGSRVEFFTLPDETDVIAVYDPRGSIWETWLINT
jgi:hypothetical protein